MPSRMLPKELVFYSKLVEEALANFIPRSFDEASLQRFVGKPKFSLETSSLNQTVTDPFWDLMDRGGKRWRPILFLLAYEALGGRPEDVAGLSIIPEIIHNGTLIIDDIEDDSLYRRGKECIHRIYGIDTAINVGNLMYYIPLISLLNSKLDSEKRRRVLEAYIDEMIKLSFGQAMDIAWHRGLVKSVSQQHYMQMTSLKTGALARMAVRIPAILRDADEHITYSLSSFAESLAIAFQIQDDVLNISGERLKYGKEIGGDITEGKITLMVIYALENLDEKRSKRLSKILSLKTRDPSLITEAIELIKNSGAVSYAKKVAKQMVEGSWKELDRNLPDSDAKEKIKILADFLIAREF